jgi:hypothetical protein
VDNDQLFIVIVEENDGDGEVLIKPEALSSPTVQRLDKAKWNILSMITDKFDILTMIYSSCQSHPSSCKNKLS